MITKLILIALCFIAVNANAFPMKLEWDAPENAQSVPGPIKYRLYRRNKIPATAPWFKVVETYNLYYTAQILQFGSFVYRVTAFNSEGESAPSNELPVRVELCAREDT